MKLSIPNESTFDAVRAFMLNIIKTDFNYDFNPDWHSDISNLDTVYLNDLSLLFVLTEGNDIVGTIAGRPYDKEYPTLKGRYTAQNTIGLWRHYLRKDWRGKGLGTKLLWQFEKRARELGYEKIYLHTQKTIPGSLEYWLAKSYVVVEDTNDEYQTVHLEKILWKI